jgi:hypothetical protein
MALNWLNLPSVIGSISIIFFLLHFALFCRTLNGLYWQSAKFGQARFHIFQSRTRIEQAHNSDLEAVTALLPSSDWTTVSPANPRTGLDVQTVRGRQE